MFAKPAPWHAPDGRTMLAIRIAHFPYLSVKGNMYFVKNTYTHKGKNHVTSLITYISMKSCSVLDLNQWPPFYKNGILTHWINRANIGLWNPVPSAGIEPATFSLEERRSIRLRYKGLMFTYSWYHIVSRYAMRVQDRIRTGDLLFRRETLYPSELLGQIYIFYFSNFMLFRWQIHDIIVLLQMHHPRVEKIKKKTWWRDSNPCMRFCRPWPNHSDTPRSRTISI